MSLIYARSGCGSWECSCHEGHSVPFKVVGKCASVRVHLMPAPKGVGLAVADAIKPVLRLAGVRDVWGYTEGKSKTTLNFVRAAVDALHQTTRMRISKELEVKAGR